jgi:hypothetical protein
LLPKNPQPRAEEEKPPAAVINVVDADGAVLVIHPKDRSKEPLRFAMRKLRLESAGPGIPMRYSTVLDNPKPPGLIECKGTFGPFQVDSPGDSPLTGQYTFSNADLSVFKSIAGILASTGRFQGRLEQIVVDGEARVPDFRLVESGNRVPLRTKFHAIVDGTNGNTLLQPVEATLGKSVILCRGGVVGAQSGPERQDRRARRGYEEGRSYGLPSPGAERRPAADERRDRFEDQIDRAARQGRL